LADAEFDRQLHERIAQREAAARALEWQTDLEVVSSKWSKEGFGSVAKWTVKVKNKSKSTTWNDPSFKASYDGESGTQVDRTLIAKTVYKTIPPGKTVSLEFTEFVHSQAHTAGVILVGATRD